MLKFWTAAEARSIKKTFGLSLTNFRPNIPPHEFLEYDEDSVPEPEPGEVLLVCGTKPLANMQAVGLCPKNRTVTSMREKPIAHNGGHYLITFDPGVVVSDSSKQEVMDWDVRLAHRLMTVGHIKPPIGKYRFVNDFSDLIARIEAAYAATGKPQDVAYDLETMTFHPWYPEREIVTVQFTFERGTADVLYCGSKQIPPLRMDPAIDRWSQIHWLLNSPKVKLRGANAKYDLVWTAVKWDIECTNLAMDSMLIGTLLNENRSNSLNLHAKLFTSMGGYDDEFNRIFDKEHMERISPAKLLNYAGGDTDATQQTCDVLKEQMLEEPELLRFYTKILHPATRAFERIERRGICIDEPKYRAVGADLAVEINKLQKQCLQQLGGRVAGKYRDKIRDQIDGDKNPLTPSVLREYFFGHAGLALKAIDKTPKDDLPMLSMAHLKKFNHPEAKSMVQKLEALNRAMKTESTFVDGFLKHLRPDGRLHPSYMLFHGAFHDDANDESGSVTGRLAARDPAIQTLPKKAPKDKSVTNWAKRLRECFNAPLGKCVLNLDFSQGELRVVACLANEPTMIDSYRKGLDLHAVTGAKLGGYTIEEFLTFKDSTDKVLKAIYDDCRDRAKPMNFGLLYGMSAEGFKNYAWNLYGLIVTLAEAETMRDDFFELYGGLLGYHDMMKTIVKNDKQVVSPLGRIRHLPLIDSWDREFRALAERQAINSPVQSTLTDMMIFALHLIEKEYGHNPDLEVVAMIHDALIAYVPIEDAQLWAKRLTGIMMNLPFKDFDWEPQLNFPADAESGMDLANLSKLKLAA